MSFHRISRIRLTYKLVILNHERIKTLNSSCLFSFFLSFWFYHEKKTHIKKIQTPTHTTFHYFYSHTLTTTYYKNKKIQNKSNTIQKLQNKPQKSRNCQKAFRDLQEKWRRVVHAPPQESPSKQGVWNSFPPLPFRASGEDHCHLQQEKNAQTTCFFKSFLDVSSFSAFSLLCLFFFYRWQI